MPEQVKEALAQTSFRDIQVYAAVAETAWANAARFVYQEIDNPRWIFKEVIQKFSNLNVFFIITWQLIGENCLKRGI